MGIPSKLKSAILFNDGNRYLGETGEVTLPKLTLKTEEWRGGGMLAPVKIQLGMEALDIEWKVGGLLRQILRQWGLPTLDGVQLRFAAAYVNDETGATDAVEVVVLGRHEEIDLGAQKVGEDTEVSVKTNCVYYKLSINGTVEIEIDVLNMIWISGGVDRLAEQRAALGI